MFTAAKIWAALVVALATAVAVEAITCTPATVARLSLEAQRTEFPKAAVIHFHDVVVRTLKADGGFIDDGVAEVRMVPPDGVSMTTTSALTLTTTAGSARFNNLILNDPPKGTHFIKFELLCDGAVRSTDRLELTITFTDADSADYFTRPESSITNFGTLPIPPVLAYFNNGGDVADLTNYDTWELTTNDTGINAIMSGNTFTPTVNTGLLITFDNLKFAMTPGTGFEGRVFELQLKNIGAVVAGGVITFPAPLVITVAHCRTDYYIGPNVAGASRDNLVIGASGDGSSIWFPIRGWGGFPGVSSSQGACSFKGAVANYRFDDICNIACEIPGTAGSKGSLRIAIDGYSYEEFGDVAVVGPAAQLATDETTIRLVRQPVTYAKVPFRVVDAHGTFLGQRIANNAATKVQCTTTSPFMTGAGSKWVKSTYSDPYQGNVNRVPNFEPTLDNGEAEVELVFKDELEPDRHQFCCVVTNGVLATPTCITIEIYEDCTSPPTITDVSSTGCSTDGSGNLVACKTQGGADVIVNGSGFGYADAKIRIGPNHCDVTEHHPTLPGSTLIGKGCRGVGTGHEVLVLRYTEQVWAKWAKTYSFNVAPRIDSIVGCSDFFPSVANCKQDGTSMVQIRGAGFGSTGAKVYFYYYDPPGATLWIEPAVTLTLDDNHVNATNFPGQGRRFAIAVESALGERTVETEVTMSFRGNDIVPCPKAANGKQCNLQGQCNLVVGTCVCFQASAQGFWAGTVCDECMAGYYGPNCQLQCPGGAANACSGVAQGTCNDGVAGTGTCTCRSGYGGTSCNTICPGGVSSPCSNHGTCVGGVDPPTCACSGTAADGYWAGTVCDTCNALYVGVDCKQKCPTSASTPNSACSGHGTCSSTSTGALCTCANLYCGSDCSLSQAGCGDCPSGYWGTGCLNQCPGFSNGGGTVVVCSGHGTCSEDVMGTGQCLCTSGWATADCSVACPGTPTCSSHGQCDVTNGQCSCTSAYATTDCSKPCPGTGTAAGVCSSHGTCDSGNTGAGTCTCSLGYTYTDCSRQCPGGVASPCSLHGTCKIDETCDCYNNALQGYWQGTECNVCAPDFYGRFCNGTCPATDGVQCATHGHCTFEVVCACFDDAVDGFWQEPTCSECKPNYWGPNCRSQCPGGSCNACSGHGQCFDGRAGNGTCACFADNTKGFWKGAKCDTCSASYYGKNCSDQCPMGGGQVCSNKGSCFEGLHGNGTCACHRSDTLGFFGGAACDGCLTGFYGSLCLNQCPGTDGLGSTCSGHGSCNDGYTGTGQCTCQPYYGRADCSAYCQVTGGGVRCHGHGVCQDGAHRDGTCLCHTDNSFGYWQGALCDSCVYGYYGPSCILECPKTGSDICTGHGQCDSSTTGTGRCLCDDGWAGAKCDKECNGGAINPCNGKGQCDKTTGSCSCFQSAAFGYWDGVNCSTCDPLYNSLGCNVRCPTTPGNPTVPCDGVPGSSCFDNICSCPAGRCGTACESTACSSECDPGFYGPTCTQQCPGGGNCNNHGRCSQGLAGTGECSCFSGYWGADCGSECPGGALAPCSFRGSCSVTTGVCACATGFATPTCAVECKGGATTPCNGVGTCSIADGSCTCNPGYAGDACQTTCPGGVLVPCNGHGTCDQVAVSCACQADDTVGHWNGTACDGCKGGYFGPSCKKTCVNGNTVGQVCECNPNWSGEACDQPCPGHGTTAGICSGHGNCIWGHTRSAGYCQCATDYYTETCATHCTLSKCQGQPNFLVNGKCHNATGTCVCIDDDIDGHWADPATRCTTCKLFWWGSKCEKRCPCLDHGSCDKDTGDCNCFDTDADGHFAGVACERCKVGYIGAACRNKDIIITRQKPCSSIAQISDTSAFLLLDQTNKLIITGGRPILVCHLQTRTLVSTVEMYGTVVAGSIVGDNLLLTLNSLDSSADKSVQRNVLVARSTNPSFAVLQQGPDYSPHDITINATAASRGMQLQSVPSTGRALQTAAIFTHSTVVAKITVSDLEFLTFQSNGVVMQTINLALASQYSFSNFFDQVMTAGITNTLLISPRVIFMGGMKNGIFRLITVELPLRASNVVKDLTPNIVSQSTYCANLNCKAVAKLVTEGTYVVMAMLGEQGAAIMRFRYTQLFNGGTVESNKVLDRYATGTIVNVTAMLLDPLSNAGFVAVNLKSPDTTEPSTIFKFDLLNLQIYGSVRFQKVVDNYEIVAALEKDDPSRILFATVPLAVQINVVPLNLYAVIKLFPDIADTVGGTVITVEGEGFIADRVFNCDFNGTIVPAKYVSSREALCVAPSGGDERCSGVPLEISVLEDQYTKNDVKLRRVATPRIEKIFTAALASRQTDNAYGNLTGGEIVVLQGYGFQDSPYLNCRFRSSGSTETRIARYADRDYQYSTGTQGTRYNDARFINATHVHCIQPSFAQPTKGTATIEVTLDGTVYSNSNQPFEVVGPAVGLRTFRKVQVSSTVERWEPDVGKTFASGNTVLIDNIDVFVVDVEGQRLRTLDTLVRTVEVTLYGFTQEPLRIGTTEFNFTAFCGFAKPAVGTPVVSYTHTSATTSEGFATFSGISLSRPPAGDYKLRFTDTSTGWTFDHLFKITVGTQHVLRICKQPSSTIDNEQRTLPVQPILYVEDISGNQLPSANLVGLRVEAQYVTQKTDTVAQDPALQSSLVRLGVPVNVQLITKNETRVAEQNENFMVFDGLEMTGLYGSTYHINFTSSGLINVTSHEMSLKWCRDNTDRALRESNVLMYFAKLGTSECFLCPDGGICNGTPNITIGRDNLWRPSLDSYRFYSCETPDSSNSCIRPNGTCKVGYEGPRCSVCVSGYGHQGDFCYKCRSPAEVVGYIFALLAVALLFISVILYASLTSKLSETLPVIIKIAINHFQISSRVNQIIISMPSVLHSLFDVQLQISELVRFDIVSSECPPFEVGIYGEFVFVLLVPFIMMGFFALVLVGLYVYRRVKGIGINCTIIDMPKDREKAARRDRVMLVVGQFFAKLRERAREHHGDVERDDLRPQFYTCTQYFCALTVVILLLLYPTMLQWCVTMWSCDDIVYGDHATYRVRSFLKADRSIDCDSDSHLRMKIFAIAAAVFYFISIPGLAIGLVWRHWRTYGRVHARRLYVYVVAGYDVSTWFWEAVVTMRKAVVVFVIIFVSDGILRTYFCMWAMTLALGAHGWFQPFDPLRPALYYLEGLGIATIVVTLNLALLFQFDIFAEGKALNTVLVIFLFALNTIVLLILALFILYHAFMRAKQFYDDWRASVKNDDDSSTTEDDPEEAFRKRRASSIGAGPLNRAAGRRSVQREGLLGAIRRASHAHFGMDMPQKSAPAAKKIDVRNIPLNDNETPFERLQRLEAEREKEQQREHHVQSQAELEKELADLKQQMVRAQALAAAEEAVIRKFPEVAEMRQKHEDELYRLMDEIRQVRGDYAVGSAGTILAQRMANEDEDHLAEGSGSEYSDPSGDDNFEMKFDEDDDEE